MGNVTWDEIRSIKALERRRKRDKSKGKRLSKILTRNATPSEVVCLSYLAQLGIVCHFQKPFTFDSKPRVRIVDIFIPEKFLAIEIDGSSHRTQVGKAEDGHRNKQFSYEYPHIRFIRFTNKEVHGAEFFKKLERLINEK